jgi:hypothetical protein
LTSRPKRSDQARIAQPEPPASAFAGELDAPSHDAAEIALECLGEFGGRLGKPGRRIVAVSAERIEINLVQDHRARSNQLFALEAVDLKYGGARPVENGKTRRNAVQPLQRAAVVV